MNKHEGKQVRTERTEERKMGGMEEGKERGIRRESGTW